MRWGTGACRAWSPGDPFHILATFTAVKIEFDLGVVQSCTLASSSLRVAVRARPSRQASVLCLAQAECDAGKAAS